MVGLNWKYGNSAFCKSAGKLFHTLVATAAKVLSPKQLEVRWTVSDNHRQGIPRQKQRPDWRVIYCNGLLYVFPTRNIV